MLEVQGVATDRKDAFPYSGLRVLGFIQLVNGLLVFLLGVLDLSITMVNYDDDVIKYGSGYDDIVKLTVAATPLWSGMWKLTFLVLNILCAALFGPVCAVVCGLLAVQRHSLDPNHYHWLLLLTICFMAVLEVFIAAATSSVTCCCSPLRGTQVHILVNPGTTSSTADADVTSNGSQKNAHVQQERDGLPERSSYKHAHAHEPPHDSSFPDHRSNASHGSKGRARMELEVPRGGEEEGEEGGGLRELNTHTLNQDHNQMRREDRHKYDGFGDDNFGSYTRLKKWALPNW